MDTNVLAGFAIAPQPTTFIVNVIHAYPAKQEESNLSSTMFRR